MELINKELIQKLQIPKLYGTEDIPTDEKIMLLKYREPNAGWFWYLCEYDVEQRLGFGFAIGFESEWGYFSLEEMEAIHTIIMDKEFVPIRFKDLK